MSISSIIANTVTVATSAGFQESTDYRESIEAQAQKHPQASHRRFHVEVTPVAEVYPDLAIAENRRTATVAVRVAYFCGGGDAGGGDRLSMNDRAVTDMWALAARLENPVNYDSANTGIRRVTDWSASMTFEGNVSMVWSLSQRCEWEAMVPAEAIA